MTKEMIFIKELVSSIVKNKNMPKVQVEREISPILEMFIEDFMNELARHEETQIDKGVYKFIAPEFPLQSYDEVEKDTNRSTNIDFLMINKNTLYFIELKTDSSSFDLKQYKKYNQIKEDNNPQKLYDFMIKLPNTKYKIILIC